MEEYYKIKVFYQKYEVNIRLSETETNVIQ